MTNNPAYELLLPDRSCTRCGQAFQPRRRDQQYCSRACKEDAYRHRKTGSGTPHTPRPDFVDLVFLAGLLDENPHWQFDLGISPHPGQVHRREWVRCGYPAREFIPVLNQLLQKFRPASVFVRILPETGEPTEYQ
ncbi:MAG: hypothetical protein KF690_00635, partial [Bacteroidetes bacterium]|nr:hypothetical protein [Bacteroidota bacterium]